MLIELCSLYGRLPSNHQLQSLTVASIKNESIRSTLARTRDRHGSQVCKQYEIKIYRSHLNKETLKQKAQTPIEVNRFFPSTRKCSRCHSLYKIERNERTYLRTMCGISIDRDLNAARNIKDKGLMMLEEKLPTEHPTRREVTPADTSASTLDLAEYLNNIPRVRASVVVETGSQAVVVKRTIFSRG